MKFLNSTVGGVIGDLDLKDWRDILKIRYNNNGPELTPQEKGTLLVQIHLLA
jgi:hypothetical protein